MNILYINPVEMSKKIDFFSKNEKKNSTLKAKDKINMTKNSMKPLGSKTAKPKTKEPSPKRRGRRPKKILENNNIQSNNQIEDDHSQKNDSAVILRLNIDPSKLKNLKNTENENIKNTKDVKEPKNAKTSTKNTNATIIAVKNNTTTTTNIKNIDENTKNKNTKNDKPVKNNKPNDNISQTDIKENCQADENDESSEGMFRNDIPGDNTCHKCAKNEKSLALLKSRLEKYEKKDKLDKSNKIYSNKLNFISLTSGKKIIIKKTNTKCWWDSHNFTNLPCFLPELFHNGTYHVTGCFCSFNCALAYNLYYLKDSKIHHRKSLIYKLYQEMYGLTSDEVVDLKEAPPKEILEDFGGDMTIDVFRRSFITLNKEYIVFIPPIKPISVMIEERNIETVDDDHDKEYVLKRSKPLAKKRSIISSMKMKLDDGDDD